MKYDDASWHYGGEFPAELLPEAGATHIGMYVAWAMLNGLASAENLAEYGDLIHGLGERKMTPGRWFISVLDEKFVDQDLSDEGNAFSLYYYGAPQDRTPLYLEDYASTFDGFDELYFVEDSWANFDRIAPRISARFAEWKRSKLPWWKKLI